MSIDNCKEFVYFTAPIGRGSPAVGAAPVGAAKDPETDHDSEASEYRPDVHDDSEQVLEGPAGQQQRERKAHDAAGPGLGVSHGCVTISAQQKPAAQHFASI